MIVMSYFLYCAFMLIVYFYTSNVQLTIILRLSDHFAHGKKININACFRPNNFNENIYPSPLAQMRMI